MNVRSLFHSASARVEEKIYSVRIGLSVYVGLVRSSLEEKLPFLSKHVLLGVGLAFFLVVFFQLVVVLLSLLTLVGRFIWNVPHSLRQGSKTLAVVLPARQIR